MLRLPPMVVRYLLDPLAVVACVSLVAWSAGLPWVVGSRLASSPAGRWGMATALGLALLGVGGYALGAAGALRPLPVALVAIALAAPGLPHAWRSLARLRRPRGGQWAVGLVAAVGLVLALYPPLPFDETLYHLPMARAYAHAGAMPFLTDLRMPVFPALFEVLVAETLLFDGDLAAHLLSWLSVAATAALLVDWGRRGGSPVAGRWAAALYVGSPLVAYLAGTAYVEPLLALFATAALSALESWWRRPASATAAAAALAAAACASTKYLGLVVPVVLCAALGCAVIRERRLWRQAALAALVLAVVAAVPYGRIVWWTGNPVFPFVAPVFGASEWTFPVYDVTLGSHLSGWLRAPFDAVFARHRVGGQPPISPVYMLTLPLIVLAGSPWSRAVLAVSALYAVLVPVHARYLMLLAPVLALAATFAVARWPPTAWLGGRRWRGLVTLLLLLPSLGWAGHRLARLGPLPASAEARERFLLGRVPGFEALAFLNRTHGAGYTVYAAYAEHLRDYARGRYLGDWAGPHAFGRVLDAPTAAALRDQLGEAGAGYLLLPAVAPARRVEDLVRPSPLFRQIFRGDTAVVYAVVRDGRASDQ
jgi:hypothetical protein